MSVQVCQAPIVFPKVHQATTYSDVADALSSLESLIDFVYSGITAKITQEKSRLTALSSRIEVAQIKTKQLVGSQNAITVYSAAKYPAPAAWSDSMTVFGSVKEPLAPQQTVVKPIAKAEALGPSKEMLVDVQEVALFNEVQGVTEKHVPSGLGIPKINHVSSLLLFNSTDNVYKRYTPADNLRGVMAKPQKKKVLPTVLPPPPESVVTGESMATVKLDGIGWQPGPVAALEHNFPNNLPLSNVADTNWVGKFPPINPSDNIALSSTAWNWNPISSTVSSPTPSILTDVISIVPTTQNPVPTATQPSNHDHIFNAPAATTAAIPTHHVEHARYNHAITSESSTPSTEPVPNAAVFHILPDPSTIPPPLTAEQSLLPSPPLSIPDPQITQTKEPVHVPIARVSMEARPRSFLDDISEGNTFLRPTPSPTPLEGNKPLWICRIEAIREAVAGDGSASEASEDMDWEA